MMREASAEGLFFVGGIPRPIGGVTQHVWRLSLLLDESQCTVCDLHPRSHKYASKAALRVAPRQKWLRLPWLLRELQRSRASVAHMHFSECSRVGLLRPFLALDRRTRFRMLTLHHGNQHRIYEQMGSWMQGCVKLGLRHFDRIVSLSADQHDFYRNVIGIPERKLFSGSSYVPFHAGELSESDGNLSVDGHDGTLQVPAKRPGTIRLVASGYPHPCYHHEETIKVVDSLRRDRDIELFLCLYGGVQDQAYHAQIMALIAERPYIHLLQETDFLDFARLLKSADLYLRPNSIDSYGIAVADAITLGTPAVTTDVCERHPDAVLFPTNDFASFEATARRVLDDRQAYDSPLRSAEDVDIEIQTSLAMYADVLELPVTRSGDLQVAH